jgi:hypothetical protein
VRTEAEIRAKIEELLTQIGNPRTKKSALPLLYSQVTILHWAIGETFELELGWEE